MIRVGGEEALHTLTSGKAKAASSGRAGAGRGAAGRSGANPDEFCVSPRRNSKLIYLIPPTKFKTKIWSPCTKFQKQFFSHPDEIPKRNLRAPDEIQNEIVGALRRNSKTNLVCHFHVVFNVFGAQALSTMAFLGCQKGFGLIPNQAFRVLFGPVADSVGETLPKTRCGISSKGLQNFVFRFRRGAQQISF